MRLLEVVPDDLVVLAQASAFAALLLEPAGEALVELRAHRLRDSGVRLVADQRMAKPVRVLARYLRA